MDRKGAKEDSSVLQREVQTTIVEEKSRWKEGANCRVRWKTGLVIQQLVQRSEHLMSPPRKAKLVKELRDSVGNAG